MRIFVEDSTINVIQVDSIIPAMPIPIVIPFPKQEVGHESGLSAQVMPAIIIMRYANISMNLKTKCTRISVIFAIVDNNE